MELEKPRERYIAELRELYSAETQLIEALPKMADRAVDLELKCALEVQAEESKKHRQRLENVFETLQVSPRGKHCNVIGALVEEVASLVKGAGSDTIDPELISSAQRFEHYQIAAYGTVRMYAVVLGEIGHLKLFQQTWHEEAVADDWLAEIAQRAINRDVASDAGPKCHASRSARDAEVIAPTLFDRVLVSPENPQFWKHAGFDSRNN